MSLARSRSGEMVTMVAPNALGEAGSKPSGSGLLDVAISRTSTLLEPLQPTGRTSPVASTRSSVACVSARQLRRSRRAAGCRRRLRSILPIFSANAPGNAPATWPNKLLSMMFAATALQSTLDDRAAGTQPGGVDGAGEGFLAGAGFADDQYWQAVARGLGGDRQRGAEIRRGADQLLERQFGRQFLGAGRQFAGGAAPVGSWRLSASSSRSGATGSARKSLAPARIASTAMRDRFAVGNDDDRQFFGRHCVERGDQRRARSRRPSSTARPALRGRAGPAASRRRFRHRPRRRRSSRHGRDRRDHCRRSAGSASTSNSERRTSSRIGLSHASAVLAPPSSKGRLSTRKALGVGAGRW